MGQHDATSASRDARHCWSNDQLGQRKAIAKPDGPLAQYAHEQQGNAASETTFDDAS
jgi:tRNA U34 5-methylaminomethyl-2-thiouridine-forming methyltransferase MnmC